MAWMKQAQPLTQQLTQQYRQDFLSDPHSVAMKNAAAHNDMKSLAAVPEAARQVRPAFSNTVETMNATNQKSSRPLLDLRGAERAAGDRRETLRH